MTRRPQLHVVRVGPERVDEVVCYYAWAPGEGFLEMATNDLDGLSQLLVATSGRTLRCEPQLVAAAGALALPTGVPPRGAYTNAACLALLAVMGELAPAVPGRKHLVAAAGELWRRRPWVHWKDIWRPELSIRIEVDAPGGRYTHAVLVRGSDATEDGEARGFYLLADAETADLFVDLHARHKEEELEHVPALRIIFERQPAWATRLFDLAASGTSAVPIAVRTTPKGVAACTALECARLAAAAHALAKLTPENRTSVATVDTPLGHVRARVKMG